ncbi:uncharacterized protein LOC124696902 [Lolium rigidum]|uniref:uncharacterized protein LOC124696902 n=1 Tax=Lolium rigidum TaxID=89674 RepID=UPI001F5D4E11|nr:uncharacterized protein LOC124696902 [Lolium rigidum]
MEGEGRSGKLMAMAQQSGVRSFQGGAAVRRNPSGAGEESAKVGSGKSAEKTAEEAEMADEAETFAAHPRLSSMQFTHYTPGRMPRSSFCSTPETLQIFSIKLTRLDCGLEFPLCVYGVVAIRDMVDRNRNILFSRDISEAQELKQSDPFLHLIGPSRAILFTHHVGIEIQLRVAGTAGSQDRALISYARRYSGGYGPGVTSLCFKNILCTLELRSQPVKRTVQATILGVQVTMDDGSWPLKYGGLVACSPLSEKIVVTDDGVITRNIDPPSSQIVLLDSMDKSILKGDDGYVHLWRQVVSVELRGGLDLVIQAYSKSGDIATETCVRFMTQVCNISQKKCTLGDAEVTFTVAWSRVPDDYV